MNRIIARVAGLIAALLLLASCGQYEFRGGVVNPATAAPPLNLTLTDGTPFKIEEYKGKVVVVFFGFTNCPDICPTALFDMASAKKKIGTAANDVEVVLVTVDPERDTPQKLAQYVTRFDPAFKAVSGTNEQLQQAYKEYGVTVIRRDIPDSALKYTMDHSGFLYVIDRGGRWRVAFTPDMTPDDMASDLRFLLNEQG